MGNTAILQKVLHSQCELQQAAKIAREQACKAKLNISEPEATEIIDFCNRVILDGRYIRDLATNPRAVADKLNLGLPAYLLKNPQSGSILEIYYGGDFGSAAETMGFVSIVAVGIGVVVGGIAVGLVAVGVAIVSTGTDKGGHVDDGGHGDDGGVGAVGDEGGDEGGEEGGDDGVLGAVLKMNPLIVDRSGTLKY
jgi:hypothetical protein